MEATCPECGRDYGSLESLEDICRAALSDGERATRRLRRIMLVLIVGYAGGIGVTIVHFIWASAGSGAARGMPDPKTFGLFALDGAGLAIRSIGILAWASAPMLPVILLLAPLAMHPRPTCSANAKKVFARCLWLILMATALAVITIAWRSVIQWMLD